MTLPNYFLADLPPEAELTPAMLTDACLALKRNRNQYLAVRDTPSLLRTLVRTGEDWLCDDYPYRKLALKEGPAHTGFSTHTIATGLDNFFKQLTGENLEALLAQELGTTQRLDIFCASTSDNRTRRLALASGPELLGHITAVALSGGVTLDAGAAHRVIGQLAATLAAAPDRVARAMLDIADASVARALRRVSVERGISPRDCVLVPFGGGGPLHACGLAEQLGMRTIFVPPHAGVLSAVGLAITPERRERMVSVLARADGLDGAALRAALSRAAEGVAGDPTWDRSWTARMRYVGQGHELDVATFEDDDGDTLARRFAALHAQRNGFTLDAPVEVIGIRHVASGAAHPITFARAAHSAWRLSRAVDDGGTFAARIAGPAVIMLSGATLRIAAGWIGEPHPTGGWLLAREHTT